MTLTKSEVDVLVDVYERRGVSDVPSCIALKERGYIKVQCAHDIASLVLTPKGEDALLK